MKKATILDLYIKDLESHVPKSEARDNRLKVLKEELDKELTASAVSCSEITSFEKGQEYVVIKTNHRNRIEIGCVVFFDETDLFGNHWFILKGDIFRYVLDADRVKRKEK